MVGPHGKGKEWKGTRLRNDYILADTGKLVLRPESYLGDKLNNYLTAVHGYLDLGTHEEVMECVDDIRKTTGEIIIMHGNGSVELEIPDDFSMDFDIEVRSEDWDHGYEIDSDFDLEIESKEYRSGKYRVYGTGSIGGGRNKVRIRATNGDVVLQRVSRSR